MLSETRHVWDGNQGKFVRAPADERFLRGPVPMSWLSPASALPGKALAVGLALWRIAGLKKSLTVKLGTSETEAWGVNRSAKARALRSLTEAGLIRVDQKSGCLPLVTIVCDERWAPK